MVMGSGAAEQSIGELSAAVAETVNRLNSLTDSMDAMAKWRSEAEKHAKETTKTMSTMNTMIASLVEMMNKRFPSDDDIHTPYLNPSKQLIQVNGGNSEPGGSDTLLGYRRITDIMPDRDSLIRKVDMPMFDGKHPYGWIARMENFFRVGQYSEHQKLELIALSLEGDVLSWYNGEDKRLPFKNWTELKKRIVSRFGNHQMSTPKQCLAVITQTGTVADYVRRFEEVSSLVVGVDDEMLEAVFLEV
ncbi:Retrotrans_gag domain-containing protein [Raphanus sativus]|nr:Retrotrans_gag domain-containing protein [Raphanus sativus]